MAVIESIRRIINKSVKGTLFFNNSFPEYDEEYVRHVLSDLCAQGLLELIAFGIYLKPARSRFGVQNVFLFIKMHFYPTESQLYKNNFALFSFCNGSFRTFLPLCHK